MRYYQPRLFGAYALFLEVHDVPARTRLQQAKVPELSVGGKICCRGKDMLLCAVAVEQPSVHEPELLSKHDLGFCATDGLRLNELGCTRPSKLSAANFGP